MSTARRRRSGGQTIVLFALSLFVLLFGVGLVIDGGYAFAQRRTSQNASDFGALAGARLVSSALLGDTVNGTDANVRSAIQSAVTLNGATVTFGSPNGPQYVDSNGGTLGYVGSGSIPACAAGVRVSTSRSWHPFFASIAGFTSWTAGSAATARAAGSSCPGVLPIVVSQSSVQGPGALPVCQGPASGCPTQDLTSGTLNIPGGFGWLKFGGTGKCTGYGLGQDPNSGCDTSDPFLAGEIGPPSNSYGCCTAVGLPGSLDQIGSLTGNKPGDMAYYIQNQVLVWLPIWDTAGGTGANGYYHIVGYAAFQITGVDTQHGKWLTGVFRSGMITGSPNQIPLGVTGAVQLVR